MRFVNTWSYSCANYLMKQMNEDHEKRRVYYFGFQVLIGTIVEIISIILVSLLMGTIIPTIIMMFIFAFLRSISGGYHMNTYTKCFITTLSIFAATGFIIQYTYMYWSVEYIILFAALTFITAISIILKWVPSDTPNRPITKPEEKSSNKIFCHG